MTKFEVRVRQAQKAKVAAGQPHDEHAFNVYLQWFLANSRVQVMYVLAILVLDRFAMLICLAHSHGQNIALLLSC